MVMRSSFPDIKFPIREFSHEKRVEVARIVLTRLMEKYKDAVFAVYVSGSTAKKLDRPFSDLELMCVVKDDLEIAGKRCVYNGLLVCIEYRQETSFLKETREPGHDWPVGQTSTGTISFCLTVTAGCKNLLRRLRKMTGQTSRRLLGLQPSS